jgi:hypothetical protein
VLSLRENHWLLICAEGTHKSFSLLILREYPPITSDQQRQLYKRNFDAGLQEYKSLQAELDDVNKELSRLDKELDDYREESEEYMVSCLTFQFCVLFFKTGLTYFLLTSHLIYT